MTLEQFIALPLDQRFRVFVEWLGEQPANKAYEYFDCDNCPLAQFGRTIAPYASIGVLGGTSYFNVHELFGKTVTEVIPLNERFALSTHRTFGELHATLLKSPTLPKPIVAVQKTEAPRSALRVALRAIARFIKFVNPLAG